MNAMGMGRSGLADEGLMSERKPLNRNDLKLLYIIVFCSWGVIHYNRRQTILATTYPKLHPPRPYDG
jgi:hypothetical protein